MAEEITLYDWIWAIVRMGISTVPVLGGALSEVVSMAEREYKARVGQVGSAAREAVGDDDLFIRRLRDDPRLRDMLVSASEAAARSSWETKRITMGRVLGQAARDDAAVDDHAALLAALAALEAVHFRFLASLADSPPPPPPLSGHPVPEPYRSQLIAQGVVALDQRGLQFEGPQLNISGVSEFGHRLLDWIRQAENIGRAGSPEQVDGQSDCTR